MRLAFFLILLALAAPASAAPEKLTEKSPEKSAEKPAVLPAPEVAANKSGLPVPRFVTTRSNAVNLRAGPGERYPVKWVLKKKGMPVEITAEYENWRKVRDWNGTEGWVHQAMLSGRRAAAVHPGPAVLRASPQPTSRPVAELAEGVIARLETCKEEWCQIRVDAIEGYILRADLWGIYPKETLE